MRAVLATLLLALSTPAPAQTPGIQPLVIAHRGASGYLPEETIEAYRLAIDQGADFLEGDVYLSADGIPFLLHDGTLDATTDVAAIAATDPEIAALRGPDGRWNATRFTWPQLQRLTAGFRAARGYGTDRSHHDPAHPYRIASLRQLADLAATSPRPVGIYPEAKQPGFPVIEAILAILDDPRYRGHFRRPGAAILQSFDPAQVARMKSLTPIPVVQLGPCPADAAQAEATKRIADGIGPPIGKTDAACVTRAHAAGLFVHPYTFLDGANYPAAYALGIDGVFTNFPDRAVAARR